MDPQKFNGAGPRAWGQIEFVLFQCCFYLAWTIRYVRTPDRDLCQRLKPSRAEFWKLLRLSPNIRQVSGVDWLGIFTDRTFKSLMVQALGLVVKFNNASYIRAVFLSWTIWYVRTTDQNLCQRLKSWSSPSRAEFWKLLRLSLNIRQVSGVDWLGVFTDQTFKSLMVQALGLGVK